MNTIQLENRIKKLEENQIAVTMSYTADMNIMRSLQRTLANNCLGIGTETATLSALLELSSVTKGLVLSRMTTTQRNNIVNPVGGLLIYNTTTNKLNVYTTAWEAVTSV